MELTSTANRQPTIFSVSEISVGQPGIRQTQSGQSLPLIVMAIVVVVWGLGPPITKLVTAPPLIGTFIRFGISSPLLLVVLAARGRVLSRKVLLATALPGLSFGINLIFVFSALQEATVSVLSTVVAMQPALLLVLAGPLFREYPSGRQLAFTLLGVVGAVGVILGAGSQVQSSWLGVGFAALALATFTLYFVLTRLARVDDEVDPIEWMAGINIWSFISTIVPILLLADRSDWAQFGGIDWLWISVVAFVTGVFGHVLMTWLHGHLEAARSSLYILTMHLVAVGLAWWIHDEAITWLQAVSGGVVLVCVALVVTAPDRREVQ
ncbi:MAG: DMT family transporter [Actinomycetota bacterium]|nr:DMT family transporter [Actinomycetota bacterium]